MRTLALTLGLAGAVFAQEDAARLFAARCGSCHTMPDPALRTDRAWLDQVNRTT